MDARLLDDTQKMKLAVFDKMDSVVFLPIASDNVADGIIVNKDVAPMLCMRAAVDPGSPATPQVAQQQLLNDSLRRWSCRACQGA